MELYEMELEKAWQLLRAAGRDEGAFSFDMSFLPPDPDGGGMFTVRYVVCITNAATAKSLDTIGGIGMDWVGDFAEELKDGYFD
jgi:hypothetical protein